MKRKGVIMAIAGLPMNFRVYDQLGGKVIGELTPARKRV